MSSSPSKIIASLGALVVLALACAGARAEDPSPAALTYAGQIIADIGVKASLDQVVAGMLGQLEHNITATRPELKDALHATLLAIQPEFNKTEQGVLADTAKFLASRMTEQDLKETATFFEGAAGKKYVEAQAASVPDIADAVRAWRQQLSTDITARAHEEMKKKGYSF